ncbi:hypothetical protein EG328_002843 [Venturia inaequalis]|uniref:Uncharacterized protein n=1 Tax=Venturia inaequalis TaxID=5025 RepID=A0A8H3UV52_VENIN|nr:hypothetical protein EG328_002843 [Venturia inaequalis]
MVRGGVNEEVRGQAEVLVKALHGLNDEGVNLVKGQGLMGIIERLEFMLIAKISERFRKFWEEQAVPTSGRQKHSEGPHDRELLISTQAACFESRVLHDVSTVLDDASRVGFPPKDHGRSSAIQAIPSTRQVPVTCAPDPVLTSVMDATAEQTLGMSTFITPRLIEEDEDDDDDGLASWLRSGIEDVLRDDTLHDEKLANLYPSLFFAGNGRDEGRSSRTEGALSDSTDAMLQVHCLLDNARTAASLHHQNRQSVNPSKINCKNVNDSLAAIFVTDTNVRHPSTTLPDRDAIGTSIKIAVDTNSNKITGSLAKTSPVLARGIASTDILSATDSNQSDGTPFGSPNFCDIDNVRTAANHHYDRNYVRALETCCIHELRGKKCTTIKCSERGPLLCQAFKKGTCTTNEFAHTGYTHVHILPNCARAIKDGQCFNQQCRLGHDNVALRRKRLADKRSLEMCLSKKWVEKIRAAMEASATPLDVSEGGISYAKLRGKLGQFKDAAMAAEVDEVLARYNRHRRRRPSWVGGGW